MTITVELFEAPFEAFAECANLPCPNGTTKDEFTIVTIGDGPIVGGQRVLRLVLCVPCAAALEAEAGR